MDEMENSHPGIPLRMCIKRKNLLYSVNTEIKDSIIPLKKVKLSCLECGKEFSSQNRLQMHITTKHVPNVDDPSKGSFISENMQEKSSKKVHMCGQLHCDSANMSHDQYIKHMSELHNIEKAFDCIDCGVSFRTALYLRRHCELHSKDFRYVCSFCGLKYRRQTGLNAHMKYKHSCAKKHECVHCGQGFVEKSKLKLHITHKHSENALYKCSFCGKSLGSKDSLKFHERIHRNERPFGCSQCDKSFRSKSDLNKHSLTHSEFGAFQCKICLKSFVRKDVVKTHLRNAHFVVFPTKEETQKKSRENGLDCNKWEDFYVNCVSKKCRKEFSEGSHSIISDTGNMKTTLVTAISMATTSKNDQSTRPLKYARTFDNTRKFDNTGTFDNSGTFDNTGHMTEPLCYGIEDTSRCVKDTQRINRQVDTHGQNDSSYLSLNKIGEKIEHNGLIRSGSALEVKEGSKMIRCIEHKNNNNDTRMQSTDPSNHDSYNRQLSSRCDGGNDETKLAYNIAPTLCKSFGGADRTIVDTGDKSEGSWHTICQSLSGEHVGTHSNSVENNSKVDSGLQKLPVNIIDKLETAIENSQATMNGGMATCISGTLEHSLGGPANLIGSYTEIGVSEREVNQSNAPNIEILILPNQSSENVVLQRNDYLNNLDVANDKLLKIGSRGRLNTQISWHGDSNVPASWSSGCGYNVEYCRSDVHLIHTHKKACVTDHQYSVCEETVWPGPEVSGQSISALTVSMDDRCQTEILECVTEETVVTQDMEGLSKVDEELVYSKPKRKQTLKLRSDSV